MEKQNINQTISDILTVFINQNKLQFALMFTKNHFALGQAQSKTFTNNDRDGILTYLMNYVIPNPDVQIEMSFRNNNPFKLYMTGFELTYKTMVIPLYLIIIYEKDRIVENRAEILTTFEENFAKLVSTMKILDLFHQSGK